MKHNTSTLTGALLDAAVAKAEGQEPEIVPYRVSGGMGITFVRDEPVCQVGAEHFEPSSRWEHGGPIIEREGIALVRPFGLWDAAVNGFVDTEGGISSRTGEAEDAPTALVAAMRAYVAAKLGDEVEF
jgi:hypothetical protein